MADTLSTIVMVVMLVLGVSYMLQPGQWVKVSRETIDSPHRFLTVAPLLLVFGLAIIINHNVWDLSWPVVVTVFGWILTIKGALYLIAPNVVRAFANWPEQSMRIYVRSSGVVITILGLMLVYHYSQAA